MKHFGFAMVTAILGLSHGALASQTLAHEGSIKVENEVVYDVAMVTILRIPETKIEIDQIRVWHALPPARPWSLNSGLVGAIELAASAGGEQQFNKAENSHHHFWDISGRQDPGGSYSFTTRFRVRSATRTFIPNAISVDWTDYAADEVSIQHRKSSDTSSDSAGQMASLAENVSEGLSPTEAVKAFCVWIKDNIKYDASVSYSATDTAAILKGRKGHCGHQSTILNQLCRQKGIPYRIVWGLNLYDHDGRGDLHRIRPDWTNVHTWAEVYFPKVGWIEVEPSGGDQAYRIPARFVQNNPWFQNYAVWIKDAGKQRLAEWEYKDGKYTSPYNIENRITFEIRPQATDAEQAAP